MADVLKCRDLTEGKPKVLRFLIEKKYIDVNSVGYDGKTLLNYAVERKQKELVGTLLALGANPLIQGRGTVSSNHCKAARLCELVESCRSQTEGWRQRKEKKKREEGNGEERRRRKW